MKKRLALISILAMVCTVVGCGVVTEQDLDAEAIRQEKRLEESIDNIEEEYKDYVEDMGIDVDAALEEAGR